MDSLWDTEREMTMEWLSFLSSASIKLLKCYLLLSVLFFLQTLSCLYSPRAVLCMCPADVCGDGCDVPGGLVSLLFGVPLGLFWGPKENPRPHGYHRTTLC